MSIQVATVILPTAGTGTEAVADTLEHTSIEFLIEHMAEKQVQIIATEVVAAGVPGNLQLWIELSPVPSAASALYWAAIGGGGGAIVPTAPTIIVGTGVNGTVHSILLPWSIHSTLARLVVRTPVIVATAAWAIQAIYLASGER